MKMGNFIYRLEDSVLYFGSLLPVGDIDVPDALHAPGACTCGSKFAATAMLKGMAREFKAPAVIRNTAGGVHAYFLRVIPLKEWVRVHLKYKGDPYYTKYTSFCRVWWDRLSPKVKRRVDDDPEDFWVYTPTGCSEPDSRLAYLWQVNCQGRKIAFSSGIEAAVSFLKSAGGVESPRKEMLVPPPPRVKRQ